MTRSIVSRLPRVVAWAFLVHVLGRVAGAADSPPPPAVAYVHDQRPEVPWSIHIVKVARVEKAVSLTTALGHGGTLGTATVREQAAKPGLDGTVLAAINGDYAKAGMQYPAHPQGLQIIEGELVTAPGSDACFWIDAEGAPHIDTPVLKPTVTWPDGRTTGFGLNDERASTGVMIYTAAFGASTKTAKGREIAIETTPAVRIGLPVSGTLTGRVTQVTDSGNTSLKRGSVVLSLSPKFAAQIAAPPVGATITISSTLTPAMVGARTAIAGGPVLLRAGRGQSSSRAISSGDERHPRSAVGWNNESIYLVVVDGRQRKLSVGMTLPELATYMKKLGCTDALNLDGGGSSTLWFDGGVRNRPCEGRERPTVNALLVVRKDAVATTAPAR